MTNKLQLRAKILEHLKEAKKDIAKKILNYDACLQEFNEIEDKKTLAKILIKEFKGNGSDYDYFLSFILTKCAPNEAEGCIFEIIMSDEESDIKKISLINILSEGNGGNDERKIYYDSFNWPCSYYTYYDYVYTI